MTNLRRTPTAQPASTQEYCLDVKDHDGFWRTLWTHTNAQKLFQKAYSLSDSGLEVRVLALPTSADTPVSIVKTWNTDGETVICEGVNAEKLNVIFRVGDTVRYVYHHYDDLPTYGTIVSLPLTSEHAETPVNILPTVLWDDADEPVPCRFYYMVPTHERTGE